MAEILGIVASIAGLAFLPLQVNESIGKLTARRAAFRNFPNMLQSIEQRLGFLEVIRLERIGVAQQMGWTVLELKPGSHLFIGLCSRLTTSELSRGECPRNKEEEVPSRNSGQ